MNGDSMEQKLRELWNALLSQQKEVEQLEQDLHAKERNLEKSETAIKVLDADLLTKENCLHLLRMVTLNC